MVKLRLSTALTAFFQCVLAVCAVVVDGFLHLVSRIEEAVFTKARIEHAANTAEKTVYRLPVVPQADVHDNGFARRFTCLLKDLNSRCAVA